MTFLLEKISDTERYKIKDITGPEGGNLDHVRDWVIDRECDVFLICTHGSGPHPDHPVFFAMGWHGEIINIATQLELTWPVDSSGAHVHRTVFRLGIPATLSSEHKKIKQLIRQAFIAYGLAGSYSATTAAVTVEFALQENPGDAK